MNSYLISSSKKSSGKTILSIGICSAIRSFKKVVAPFKKGPDYIDPLWLSKASNKNCYNLDFYNMNNSEIKNLYSRNILNADVSIVEGNKGLFDGISADGSDSNAALSKLLNLEVILILDCTGTTRGVAPLLSGYKAFDKAIKYKGVILNNIASQRHEGKILTAIKEYTDLDVIGSINKNNNLNIFEQHLGLEPAFQKQNLNKTIKNITEIIKSSVNIKSLITGKIKNKRNNGFVDLTFKKSYRDITLGIALDEAFGFYYPDDLEKIIGQGVKIKYFDTIKDKRLPKVDAIFIGGGFPEIVAAKLAKNLSMKKSIYNFIESNKPAYAECGGLMYLCESIKTNLKLFKMVGAIKGKINMNKRPVGRGYVKINTSGNHPWHKEGNSLFAHEFHYSDIKLKENLYKFGYNVQRGYGINGEKDGLVYKNLLATYAHMRDTKKCRWIDSFLKFIRKSKLL